MNYGYAYDDPDDAPRLYSSDEPERYNAQLYHVVASQIDLAGLEVVDIGSGRGGGASHVHRYLGPARTTGIDLAQSAISFCNRVYAQVPDLEFRQGNAMKLPLEDASVDAVLNVESSHCYQDRSGFFAEVLRVLRPGGHLLYADFSKRGAPMDNALKDAGFAAIRETDITQNIVNGLVKDNGRKVAFIRRNTPFGTRWLVRMWAATPGSWIFDDFANGRRSYVKYCATKAG